MAIRFPRSDKALQYQWKYGMAWPALQEPLVIEMEMVRAGGLIHGPKGQIGGNGLEFHFKEGMKLCFPWIKWHKWLEDFVHWYLKKRLIGLMGSASTGKSHDAASVGLFEYFCIPTGFTGIYCSTTRELLQQRVWGEVVGLFLKAKEQYEWLPGHLIESRLRIVTSVRDERTEGRDFRNGLLGVPAKQGESWVGISALVGVKNKHVRLFADEASLLPKAIAESIANLDKNEDFKVIAMANPKDTTDTFGMLCEPNAALGGWDGGIDQQPFSKVWDTKRPDGVCLQRVGTDSPNLDGKLGIPLITQEQIDRDVAVYGKDSLQYTMMDLGIMPRGQGARRVLTRQDIDKYGAKDSPFWASPVRTQIASLDAAYGGVGGDRCRLYFSEFGTELDTVDVPVSEHGAIALSPTPEKGRKQIFAVKECMNVPIKNYPVGTPKTEMESPSDQIAKFCKAECEKRGVPPQHFIFDAGMRTALVQSFSQIWSAHVVSVDSMGKPTDRPVGADIDKPCDKYYKNFVSELWWSIRLVVLARQMKNLPNDAIDDLTQREWGIVGANLTQVEPKADMKKKIGRSLTMVTLLPMDWNWPDASVLSSNG